MKYLGSNYSANTELKKLLGNPKWKVVNDLQTPFNFNMKDKI